MRDNLTIIPSNLLIEGDSINPKLKFTRMANFHTKHKHKAKNQDIMNNIFIYYTLTYLFI